MISLQVLGAIAILALLICLIIGLTLECSRLSVRAAFAETQLKEERQVRAQILSQLHQAAKVLNLYAGDSPYTEWASRFEDLATIDPQTVVGVAQKFVVAIRALRGESDTCKETLTLCLQDVEASLDRIRLAAAKINQTYS